MQTGADCQKWRGLHCLRLSCFSAAVPVAESDSRIRQIACYAPSRDETIAVRRARCRRPGTIAQIDELMRCTGRPLFSPRKERARLVRLVFASEFGMLFEGRYPGFQDPGWDSGHACACMHTPCTRATAIPTNTTHHDEHRPHQYCQRLDCSKDAFQRALLATYTRALLLLQHYRCFCERPTCQTLSLGHDKIAEATPSFAISCFPETFA